ncbi:MAG: HAD family hydrolase, partial [Candidatus Methanospirareceae archaeon]
MRGIKIISFDVDGTLVKKEFVDAVWLEGIPEAYASKEGISLEEAKRIVMEEYDKVGENAIEWYELDYWLEKFQLGISREELFNRFKDRVKLYPEVKEVLEELAKRGYRLIISSNATMPFIDFQISSIKPYFSHIFSATSHFYEVKKSDGFYAKVCTILNVKPEEVLHVGDHFVFDFLNPRKIGINAYYLDREGKGKENDFDI